jgi:hypothetical protein
MPWARSSQMPRPDPFTAIRLVSLHSVRGANFWSPRPVTRLDLAVGAYQDISSAEVPGFADALVAAFPGLVEHRCSIGERGGFIARLWRGTYAPHIVEHLALELQSAIGHEVGYGRACGGARPGEYTVVFEHRHSEVGLRAGAHALEVVRRAFAGRALEVEHALTELGQLAEEPDVPPLRRRVLCGVTGGGPRAAVRAELARRWPDGGLAVDVTPAYLLNAGLPYARSELAIVLDAELSDVPERYREPEQAAQLVSVVADGVEPAGIVIVPAGAWEVQDRVRDADRRVAVFTERAPLAREELRAAHAAACIRQGRILIECRGVTHDAGPVRNPVSPLVELVAALAVFSRSELQPDTRPLEVERL